MVHSRNRRGKLAIRVNTSVTGGSVLSVNRWYRPMRMNRNPMGYSAAASNPVGSLRTAAATAAWPRNVRVTANPAARPLYSSSRLLEAISSSAVATTR